MRWRGHSAPDQPQRTAGAGLGCILGCGRRRWRLAPAAAACRAPELLYGARQYGPAVDIWAAGLVAAEVLGEWGRGDCQARRRLGGRGTLACRCQPPPQQAGGRVLSCSHQQSLLAEDSRLLLLLCHRCQPFTSRQVMRPISDASHHLPAGLSPLIAGASDIDQLARVQSTLGTISTATWPEAAQLPDWGKLVFTDVPGRPVAQLLPAGTPAAADLIASMLRCAAAAAAGARARGRGALMAAWHRGLARPGGRGMTPARAPAVCAGLPARFDARPPAAPAAPPRPT